MRKFAIALIIILGVIIIWSPECVENTNDNKNCLERIIIEEPEIRDINYPGIKEDDTSEYKKLENKRERLCNCRLL